MIFEALYTAEEMRVAESGHDVEAMMARAGAGVALEAMRAFPHAVSWTVVCGGGANGGDGRIAAQALREAGREVLVVDAKAGETALGSPDAIVDALFGTGFAGEPRADAAALIDSMNGTGVPVVSVDVPSGVDASTGEVAGTAVRAALTVTMHAPKVGLAVAPGRFHAGEVVPVDIGLSATETRHRLVTRSVLGLVPRKTSSDTKYSAGSVLVVGGSPGMTGAATLTAQAAFRADAGYVAICAPAASLPVLETLVVEAVKRPLEEVDAALERATALAIGPGLGRAHAVLVRRILEAERPAVVDADGLHELKPFERGAPTVLTPHSGELGRLLGRESAWVDEHRLEALTEAVERFRCVVLLKGADTLVGAPGEGVLVCANDVPALATAGTGDVLSGVVAAFLAKGMDARIAAAAAATAHAAAAELGPERGLVASDVVDALPDALDAV
jgi:NAD(P)H-hydrate epimerase